MIKKIAIRQLLPGMYVVDLHQSWLVHGFWRQRFKVKDDEQVVRLLENGIEEVSIDTARGRDLPPEPRPAVAPRFDLPPRPPRPPPVPPPISLGEERRRAGRLIREGCQALDQLSLAAQAGQAVEVGVLEPVVQQLARSVARQADALVPLARLKSPQGYAAEHAVASAGLMIALGQQQGLSEPEIEKMALGTLLKDIGHIALDEGLMSKPGALSDAEYRRVQCHVEEGLAVLQAPRRLPETAVAVILEHHERHDGSGYPYGVAGDEISLAGRMVAVVDAYDAMTSDRPYRKALSPTAALRHLYEAGGQSFDPALVAALVKTVGVYPVGTLVRLESDHLAVVHALHASEPTTPVVTVIYHAGRQHYITPVRVDLSRLVGNPFGRVVRAESFTHWGISPQRWQPA
ncbi:MAG: HD-GYP domain-containing protein [Dechloromonas sp.]|nr:HD-GYP domain-containing protein [Dechloromonas sp.]